MGTFYGGIAHVASLVMVCELAGSYDLLVPLMLAEGIAFVALRRHALYRAQPRSRRDSPAHPTSPTDVLKDLRVGATMAKGRPFSTFELATPMRAVSQAVSESTWQDVFPVLDRSGKMAGMITADLLRVLAVERDLDFAVAADAMEPPVTVRPEDDLRAATIAMQAANLREIVVVDDTGRIIGFLDEADIARAYLESTALPERESAAG